MKNLLVALGIIIILGIAGFYAFNSYIYNEKQEDETLAKDYKNLSFLISGEWVHLKNGVSEIPAAPGSASMITTRYFGNEAKGDLNGDGIDDIVFLVTEDGGGSGTFFYLVGAIQTADGRYRGTNAVLIGDRIAPQTTEYRAGEAPYGPRIIVNYAERKPDEPMTARPSIGKSLYLKYNSDTNDFGEVLQNFEGESAAPVSRISAKIGERRTALGVSITPRAVVSDSRCPVGVTCVWAGTVTVRTSLESGLGIAEQIFELNVPITTEAEEVTLLSVEPAPREGVSVSPEDYVFTFGVRKR